MQDKGKRASIAELRASVEPALALLAGSAWFDPFS
jgi:hypothetical protein